jgi:hypothetical protein
MRPRHLLVILTCLLLTMPLWTGPASADVIISDISVDKDEIPYLGCVNITVTVSNTGASDYTVKVLIYVDKVNIDSITVNMYAHSTENVSSDWCPSDDEAGSHIIRAKVNDNSFYIQVYAHGPDVIITEFSVDQNMIELNGYLHFTMTVENREPSLIDSFDWSIYMDNKLVYNVPHTVDPGTSLTKEHNFKAEDDYSIGAHTFMFVVFDEAATISVTFLGIPDVDLRYIECEEWAEAGETIEVMMNLRNRGSADAHNLTVYIRLDDKVIGVAHIETVEAHGDVRHVAHVKIPGDTEQGEHMMHATLDNCTSRCEATYEIYISNPLGGTPVHYYLIGFVLAGVVMGAVLAFFVLRGAKGPGPKAKAPKDEDASDEDDDIVILED